MSTERHPAKHHNIIRRYWDILNMYPRIHDPELARRIESFTLNATPEQLFEMQKAVIGEGAGFMAKEPGWRTILERMDGKKVGIAVGREYRTTVHLRDLRFEVEMGIEDKSTPVLSVASRKDYVDALLRRKDIVTMLVTRKLRATHVLTLARWGLSFHDLLHNDALFEDLVSHKSTAEKAISETLSGMKF